MSAEMTTMMLMDKEVECVKMRVCVWSIEIERDRVMVFINLKQYTFCICLCLSIKYVKL